MKLFDSLSGKTSTRDQWKTMITIVSLLYNTGCKCTNAWDRDETPSQICILTKRARALGFPVDDSIDRRNVRSLLKPRLIPRSKRVAKSYIRVAWRRLLTGRRDMARECADFAKHENGRCRRRRRRRRRHRRRRRRRSSQIRAPRIYRVYLACTRYTRVYIAALISVHVVSR